MKGTNPTENHIQVVLSGEEGLAEVTLYIPMGPKQINTLEQAWWP